MVSLTIVGYPTPVFLPGEFHGQRSLAGHSPRGCKELDTTEATNTYTHTLKCNHGVIMFAFKSFLYSQEDSSDLKQVSSLLVIKHTNNY